MRMLNVKISTALDPSARGACSAMPENMTRILDNDENTYSENQIVDTKSQLVRDRKQIQTYKLYEAEEGEQENNLGYTDVYIGGKAVVRTLENIGKYRV